MKPRVLFIMHMPPPVHGASMMGAYIHDSKVINEAFDCHYLNLTLAKDINDIGKGGIRKLIVYLKKQIQIAKTVKRIKSQLCYLTPNTKGGAFYKDFCTLFLLKCLGQKIIIHFHNKGVKSREGQWPDKWLYKAFFKNIQIILLAPPLYNDIQKFVKPEQVVYCPNGIPQNVTYDFSKKRNNPFKLLFLSNMLREKGVWDLIDALNIVKNDGYSFHCDYIGKWSDIAESEFNQKVKHKNLDKYIQAHGAKYREEKELFLKQADLFIFPTYYHNECFPLVLLEAMEQGLPCISTNEGGIPGIIEEGKTGFIVEKHSPQQLAEKIEYLIGHPMICAEMGKAGKEKFQREFTLEKFENRMKDILKECIASYKK